MKTGKHEIVLTSGLADADRLTVIACATEAGLPIVAVTASAPSEGGKRVVIGGQETFAKATRRANELHQAHPHAIACAIEEGVSVDRDAHPDKQVAALIVLTVILPDSTELSERTEITHLPTKVAQAIWKAEGKLGIGEALMAHPPPKFDILDWPERLKPENGFDINDWQATYKGRSRAELIREALVPLLRRAQEILAAKAKERTIDLTNGHEPAYVAQAGDLEVRLPVRTTRDGFPRAFFDLLGQRALDESAIERLAKALAAIAPKATNAVVGHERSAVFAYAFARALGVPLTLFRTDDRTENPTGDEPEKQDFFERFEGKHLVVISDTLSTWYSLWTDGVPAPCRAAHTVTFMAVFQEGLRSLTILDDEDVITLGTLPLPVPASTDA